MKILVSFVFVTICAVVLARPDDKYTSRFDNINLDEILKNDRLLRAHLDCLLGTKKCSKEGETLKEVLPEALENRCAKCTEKQQEGAKKAIRFLIKNKRDWWNELAAVYDPKGIYTARYKEEAKKEGIDLE